MKKRLISLFVFAAMMLAMLPAMGIKTRAITQPELTYLYPEYVADGDPASGIKGWKKGIVSDYEIVEDSSSALTWDGGWYVVKGNVTVSETITVSGSVKLLLCDGATLSVSTTTQDAAIHCDGTNGSSFTVYAQTEDRYRGTLKVEGGQFGAGIGGCYQVDGKNITINGGTIDAVSGTHGAGIGGGFTSAGKNIVINGGRVIAEALQDGTGIGGGENGAGTDNLIINGGRVEAEGHGLGVGIGTCGDNVACGSIIVNGGSMRFESKGITWSDQYYNVSPMGSFNGTCSSIKVAEGLLVRCDINGVLCLLTGTDGEYKDAIMAGAPENRISLKIEIDAPVCEITDFDNPEAVGKVFATISEACDYCAYSSCSIKLISDFKAWETQVGVLSSCTLVLDLNGYAITTEADVSFFNNYGYFTIKDSSAKETTRYFTDTLCAHNRLVGCYCVNCENNVAAPDGVFETYLDNTADTPNAIAVAGGVICSGYDTSAYGGGAVHGANAVFDDTYCAFENIAFVGNRSANGGAVCSDIDIIVRNCKFFGNGGSNGGAINSNRRLYVTDSEFAYNVSNSGGAIYTGAKVAIENTSIHDNTAQMSGGGVYVSADGCFIKGTRITMADGTKKSIEKISVGDYVRTFNHETGAFAAEPVVEFYAYENPASYTTLHFSNGVDVSVVYAHGFLEQSSMEYVNITPQNAQGFIGKNFYNAEAGRWETLESVTENAGTSAYYCIYTAHSFNCLAEGMLTLPDDVLHMGNLFEMDADLSFNAAAMAADIATYGLFTIEQCEHVSSLVYDLYNIKYVNILLGKGLIAKADLYGRLGFVGEEPQVDYAPAAVKPLLAPAAAPKLSDVNFADYGDGAFIVGNNVVIKDNTVDGKPNNLYLSGNGVIWFFDAENAKNIHIGVSSDATFDYITGNGIPSNAEFMFEDDIATKIVFTEADAGSGDAIRQNDHFELIEYPVDTISNITKGVTCFDDNLSATIAKAVAEKAGVDTSSILVFAFANGNYSYLEYDTDAWKVADGTKTLAELQASGADVIGYTSAKENSTVTTAPAAQNRTEDGTERPLVTAGVATGGTLEYKLGKYGTFSTAIPKATDPGEYEVYYRVLGDADHLNTNEVKVTVTVSAIVYANYHVNQVGNTTKSAALDSDTLTAAAAGLILNNSTITFAEGDVVGYALSGTAYKCLKRVSGAWTSLTGTKTLAELKTAKGYVIGVVTLKTAPVVTAPTALTLTENGTAQTLITAGSTTGGTLEYKLDTTGTYSTTLPWATEAGSYDVYYRVVGNDDYLDAEEAKVTVTVSTFPYANYHVNQVGTTTKSAALDSDTLTAAAAGLILNNSTITFAEGDVVGYALSGTAYKCLKRVSGAWTSLSGTKTLAELKTAKGYVIGVVTLKTAPVVTAPTALTLTENGTAQTLITAGSTTGGTLEYKLDITGTYSTTLPWATEAGSYDVYYRVVGNDDYLDAEEAKVTVTISAAVIPPVPPVNPDPVVPATGDFSMITWAAMALAAAIGGVMAGKKKKK